MSRIVHSAPFVPLCLYFPGSSGAVTQVSPVASAAFSKYEASDDDTFFKCSACSTVVYRETTSYRIESQPSRAAIAIPLGALTEPNHATDGSLDPRFMPECHVYYSEGLLSSFDFLPKYKELPPHLGGIPDVLPDAAHGYSKPVEERSTSLEFTNKLNAGLKAYATGLSSKPAVAANAELPFFEGSCHCGTVRIRVRGTPNFAVNCHCSMCRRTHAVPHVALCGYQNTDIEVTSKGGKQDLAVYNCPGTGIWERGNGEVFVRDEDRYSCKICSTKVYTDLHQLGCSAVFPSCLAITDSKGQLDPRFRPSAHIFYPSGFLDSFDELPKLQGFPPAFGGTDGRLFRNDYHNGFKKWPWKEAYGTSVVAVLSLIGLFSTPNWEPILSWIGAGAEWREMPWRSWMDPAGQWERLPSFLILEYWYFVLALICLAHARLNGALDLWFAGWFCGTANDVICMYLPLIDNFWQAQATVMLTPRLPLYIVAMYVCLMYPANTAAMRFGFRWSLAEAMCAALFASLWYGVYDVCGPRLLWWTWHDSDVAIAERLGNAPIGSTMWIWTYTFIFNLSYRWATRGGTGEWTTLIESAASLVRKHGEPYIGITMTYQARSMLRSIGAFFEKKQQFFRYRSVELTIFVVAIVCVPVFMVLLGQFSIFSLDIAGRPGIRTMVLCGATFMHSDLLPLSLCAGA